MSLGKSSVLGLTAAFVAAKMDGLPTLPVTVPSLLRRLEDVVA